MAGKGLRVLAFAQKEMPPDTTRITHADVEEGILFIGLQGMIDPPRPEAVEAVAACQKAGIRVKMNNRRSCCPLPEPSHVKSGFVVTPAHIIPVRC